MRAQFGKVNTLHTHAMPTADRPLVTGNLVGGEEGLSDAGLSLSHLVPQSVALPRGHRRGLSRRVGGLPDAGALEAHLRRPRPRVSRPHRGQRTSKSGTSFAFGPTDVGFDLPIEEGAAANDVFNKRLFGIDATFRYRPLRRAIYRRLNLRTELVWSRQDLPDDLQAKAFGFYGLGEYQFARRWYIGGRVDRSGRALDSSLDRQRRLGVPDVLADRVQPDPRPVPAHQFRRRRPRQRVPVPVQFLDRRARRARVLKTRGCGSTR